MSIPKYMIKLDVNEAEGYDRLSVEQIKFTKYPNNKLAEENYRFRFRRLEEDVGKEVHQAIIQSQEYNNLLQLNLRMFETIDLLKSPNRDKCYDEIIDNMVFERKKLQEILQKKFFPDKPYTQQKFGYVKT